MENINFEVEKLIQDLDWNCSIEKQTNAINKLIDINNSHLYLVLPKRLYCKKYWENAAKVLKGKGIENISEIVLDVFYWFKDLNWPGVDIVYDLLLELPKVTLKDYVIKAYKMSKFYCDEEWSYNISETFKDFIG